MAAIEVDPDWVAGYAKVVARAADQLSASSELLATAPLTTETFGSLGRTVRTAEAYGRASQALRWQLARGVEALAAASDGLTQVADQYKVSDDDGAHSIRRSGRD